MTVVSGSLQWTCGSVCASMDRPTEQLCNIASLLHCKTVTTANCSPALPQALPLVQVGQKSQVERALSVDFLEINF
jgi:hypothetical protein